MAMARIQQGGFAEEVQRMRERLDKRLQIQEPVAFAHDHLLPRLSITPKRARIALHITCSSTCMGLDDKFLALAKRCADDVVVLSIVGADGTQRFNPPAQTQLDEGDEVVVVGRTGGIKDVIDCIQSPDSRRAAG